MRSIVVRARPVVFAFAVLAALGSLPARAVVVPHAVFEEEAGVATIGYVHGIDPAIAETVSFDNRIESLARGTARASTTGGSLPRAETSVDFASETNFRYITGGASASVGYYFYLEQTGGTPVTDQIPIDIITRGGIRATANETGWISDTYAHALVSIDTHGVDVPKGVHSCIPEPCTGTPKSFEHAFTGYAVPGQLIQVSLVASVSGGALQSGGAFAGEAWVDPVIGISASYTRRDDFRIVFSEGVTAVPEPSTLWLGGAGFAVLAGARRLRRRRAG